MMRQHWKPIVALLAMLPVVTELLVGMPITLILHPLWFLLLATVGYGFPVLVVREISVRRGYGALATVALGLVYSLYNEAFVAKTLLEGAHSPVDTFASYGVAGGVRIPWMLTIGIWHALHAVLYPIAFTHYLFPEHAEKPWLGWKAFGWAAGISTAFALLAFFSISPDKPRGTPGQFLFFVLISAFLWFAAARLSGALRVRIFPDREYGRRAPLSGALVYTIFFLIPLIFSKLAIPAPLFVIYYLIVFSVAVARLRHAPDMPLQKLVLIGFGGAVCVAGFALLITLPVGYVIQGLTSFALVAIFATLAMRVRKRVAATEQDIRF